MENMKKKEGTAQEVEPPLDLKKIEVTNRHGQKIRVSAVNIGFMEIRKFVLYKPLCLDPSIYENSADVTCGVSEEEWVNRMLYIQEDLRWVLRLPHHRFWSQTVYDDELMLCLESYLSYGPRKYDTICSVKEEWTHLLKSIHRLVFMSFLRMSTYKESKTHHITPAAFGDFIYDYYVFDIPKILDLCSMYGQENKPLLTKMITNVFNVQPKYKNDLEQVTPSILKFFSETENMLSKSMAFVYINDPAQSSVRSNSVEDCVPLDILLDIVCSISDACITLVSFLDIYSPACSVFHGEGITIQIASFYNTVFPPLEYQYSVWNLKGASEHTLMELNRQLSFAKTFAVEIFRNIIASCCLQPIMENCSDGSVELVSCGKWLEELIQIFEAVSFEKYFIHDYNLMYPIETDLSILSAVCPKTILAPLEEILKRAQHNSEFPVSSETNSQKEDSEEMTGDEKLSDRSWVNYEDEYDDSYEVPLVSIPEVETEAELNFLRYESLDFDGGSSVAESSGVKEKPVGILFHQQSAFPNRPKSHPENLMQVNCPKLRKFLPHSRKPIEHPVRSTNENSVQRITGNLGVRQRQKQDDNDRAKYKSYEVCKKFSAEKHSKCVKDHVGHQHNVEDLNPLKIFSLQH